MTACAELKHRFAIPVQERWALIGDFGDVGKWSGRPEGYVRESDSISLVTAFAMKREP